MGSQSNADAAGGRPHALPWPAVCWIVVLLLIGIVQIVRAQWFDAAVFAGAALLAVFGERIPRRGAVRVPTRALAAGAVTAGAVVALLPRHSAGMVVAVLGIGVVAVAVVWMSPGAEPRGWNAGLRRLAWAWGGLFVIGCLWELAQFIVGELHPDDPSYALSDLIDPLLDGAPGRILFVAAWLAAGAFLLRRGRRR